MSRYLGLLGLIIVAASPRTFAAAAQPNAPTPGPASFAKQKFDYIVVGGGNAGVVVAARLSEDPKVKVGLIEAGLWRKDDPLIDIPSKSGLDFGNPDYDWNLVCTPQPGLNGRTILQTRGKVLGGSSALNTFTWQRPSRRDFDIWANDFQNGPGWTFDALEPYFEKTENWTQPPVVLPGQTLPSDLATAHGENGPLQISYNNYYPRSIITSSAAANALGIPTNSNPDLGDPSNITLSARSVDPVTGKRSYSAPAYYEPNVNRPNLVLLTGAHVSKLVFKKAGKTITATGVQYIVNGTTYTASVTKEVVLSAGTFNTPQILELSGVGNSTLLKSLGIPVVLNLPQVGENLQEHTSLPSQFVVKPGVVTQDDLNWNATFAQEQQALFDANHTGAFTYTTAVLNEVPLQTYINASDMTSLFALFNQSAVAKDHLQAVQYRSLWENLVRAEPWTEFAVVAFGGLVSPPVGNNSYLTPISLNYHPLARGYAHINTTDPLAPIVINPRYLDNEFDVTIHAYATMFARKWFQTAPLVDDVSHQDAPASSVQSLDDFKAYTRDTVRTTFHPYGTTPMAPLELDGVVDSRLRVHGLANVRIADAGIFPTTISAAPQPLVYVIGEKAADLIKEDNH